MFKFIICIAIAYLLGNISGGMIFGKLLFNKDIRDYGSKNAGTTNALRVFGIKAGVLTFIIDVLKSRKQEITVDYFFHIPNKEKEAVEFICTDMSYTFKPLLKLYFPHSTLLVDHLCKILHK